MTDIRDAGLVRETLLTTVPAATASAVAREVLLATPTGLLVSGLVREVLVPDTGTGTGAAQYAVSVIT
jgi:hypothetical protein